MNKAAFNCWVMTDGKVGHQNQCWGLAETLGLEVQLKKIMLRFPYNIFSPYVPLPFQWAASTESDSLSPPYPDVIIASGRPAIVPALHVKKKSGGKTLCVYLQTPPRYGADFDLVVAPQHDQTTGANVVLTDGALHRVSAQKLENSRAEFPLLAHIQSPKLAVLIGGSSRHYQFTPQLCHKLVDDLLKLVEQGWQLMITTSRRTGEENSNYLQEKLQAKAAFFWDGQGANPYFALLAHADAILATEDSVSMASEAASTGKPVYILPLAGGSPKFQRFHQHLQAIGATRIFKGTIETNAPAYVLQDNQKIAIAVQQLLEKRG
ncbi:MAG: mitochondrial fission ELM1 family protein [Alphaproteobacteria bacterium]